MRMMETRHYRAHLRQLHIARAVDIYKYTHAIEKKDVSSSSAKKQELNIRQL